MAKKRKITATTLFNQLSKIESDINCELKEYHESTEARKDIEERITKLIVNENAVWKDIEPIQQDVFTIIEFMDIGLNEYYGNARNLNEIFKNVFDPEKVIGNPEKIDVLDRVDFDLRVKLYHEFRNETLSKESCDEMANYLNVKKKAKAKIIDFCTDFLKYYDDFINKDEKRYEIIDLTLKLIEIFKKGYSIKVSFKPEQVKTMLNAMDRIYDDWREYYNLEEAIDVYNEYIVQLRIDRLNAEQKRRQSAELQKNEAKSKLDNGYKVRIDELINNYEKIDLNNFDVDKVRVINKYVTNTVITKENINELDSLLYLNNVSLKNALLGYSLSKREYYYNLLIRTYLIKKMDKELDSLLFTITDVEMEKFEHAKYLEKNNYLNELVLYNDYKSLYYELGQDKVKYGTLYDEVGNTLSDFKDSIYFLSEGVFTEKDFLSETKNYLASYDNAYSIYNSYNMTMEDLNNADELLSNGENYVILLTDDNNISYAQYDMEAEVDNDAVKNIVYNQINMLKHININDYDPHKFKNVGYSEELLKKLHYKSYKRTHTRIFYGKFANSLRESLIIVYGAHNGCMDNNSKNEYGKSTLKNCQNNIDKIENIIDAFNNHETNPELFNQILDKNDETLKQLELYCNGEVKELKNVDSN